MRVHGDDDNAWNESNTKRRFQTKKIIVNKALPHTGPTKVEKEGDNREGKRKAEEGKWK